MQPENTGKIQVRGRFSKGQSGNPAGKPKGARHQSTLLAERLFAGEIQSICEAWILLLSTTFAYRCQKTWKVLVRPFASLSLIGCVEKLN